MINICQTLRVKPKRKSLKSQTQKFRALTIHLLLMCLFKDEYKCVINIFAFKEACLYSGLEPIVDLLRERGITAAWPCLHACL